ncbi:hypothetical protein NQ314_019907 [Rhamnusium bicolor]|uniref:Uncharacterized protein n=1 Tax=Rhamnusium bicolor TaxID=1586634 RepID=A0AAV8WLJ5_9CUCU|nr:hypothetical protein NQ314_019907 [Rhamnusium bicolor]
MCFCNKLPEMAKPKSPRSPWRRNLKEPMKPRLSRKIVSNARVNLNAYWSKFEELSKQKSPLVSFDAPSTADVLNCARYSTFHDNEINENLINELMELGKK